MSRPCNAQGRSICRQSGQALVETLVAALGLLPLLLALPLLAKYADIGRAAIAASRTGAFDCSVRLDACESPQEQQLLADELRARHFRVPQASPETGADGSMRPSAATVSGTGARQPFWVDRRGQALLDPDADVAIRITSEASDALAGAGPAATRGIGPVAAGPSAFGFTQAGGLIKSEVAAQVSVGRRLAEWLRRPEGIALSLRARTALLTDAWNASEAEGEDVRSVRSRVERGRRLPLLEDAIDLAYAPIRELITGPLLAPVEPRGRLFDYHAIDVDLVPADRLEVAP